MNRVPLAFVGTANLGTRELRVSALRLTAEIVLGRHGGGN